MNDYRHGIRSQFSWVKVSFEYAGSGLSGVNMFPKYLYFKWELGFVTLVGGFCCFFLADLASSHLFVRPGAPFFRVEHPLPFHHGSPVAAPAPIDRPARSWHTSTPANEAHCVGPTVLLH